MSETAPSFRKLNWKKNRKAFWCVLIHKQLLDDLNESAVSMVTHRVPEGELSLTHAAEASGEHFAIRQENGSHGSRSLMGLVLLLSERHKDMHHNNAHIYPKLAIQITTVHLI